MSSMFSDWISRWWHKKGFGIQSPFAYDFVRNVISCNMPYYAYDELLSLRLKAEPKDCVHNEQHDKLLFRLANFHHPAIIVARGKEANITLRYLAAGCSSAQMFTFDKTNLVRILKGNTGKKLLYIYKVENFANDWAEIETLLSHDSMIIAENIRQNKENKTWWKNIVENPKMTLTFDLGNMGIVILSTDYNKQHYRI